MRPDFERLRDDIRGFDETLRRLNDLGIDVSLSGPALRASLLARKDKMRRQHEELEATQRAADRELLPRLVDLYRNGQDADRQNLRDLLASHDSFRWGVGWGLGDRIALAEDARNALALLSMKDGGNDWRDQIVALDHLCAVIERARLPVAALLREAATWSSDVARFSPALSTRALLLDYARRFRS